MKTLKVNAMLMGCFLMMGGTTAFSQQSEAEVPGDHFSLEGALELFKKSSSPEDFEHLLNSENSKVNNLDLNADGQIDYLKVIDRNEGNVHAFVLQAIVSETESQDVAVIELEKLANGKAVLQITGDADVYGIETIIEPTEEVRINAGTSTARNIVNVWAWPSVQYVYSPYYTTWSSGWSWNMRPMWWSPWRPVSYYTYNPWWQPYRPYYSVCYTHRIGYAQHMYRPYRTTSVAVYNMHHNQLNNYRSSHSNSDYNRGRDTDRMSGRDNDSYHRDSNRNGRQYSTDGQQGNSRSSGNDWSQGQEQDHRRTSTKSNDTYSRDRSNDVNRSSLSWQRNSGRTQTRESNKWSGLVNPNPVTHQRDHNPSFGTRSPQRSSVQMDRRGTSGGGNLQRSGHEGGSSNSGGQRRGRN